MNKKYNSDLFLFFLLCYLYVRLTQKLRNQIEAQLELDVPMRHAPDAPHVFSFHTCAYQKPIHIIKFFIFTCVKTEISAAISQMFLKCLLDGITLKFWKILKKGFDQVFFPFRYPIYNKTNPQLRIFLPNFWMKLIKHQQYKEQRDNVVVFHVPIAMTRIDVKNYLEKIYKVPVIKVNTRIELGKTKKNECNKVVKEDDRKLAYVHLVSFAHKILSNLFFNNFFVFLISQDMNLSSFQIYLIPKKRKPSKPEKKNPWMRERKKLIIT